MRDHPHQPLAHAGKALFALLLALLLGGCQASLFHLVNATSGSSGVAEHRGLVFDQGHHLALDMFAPNGAHDLPVVVFFYGGSWQDGKRQWYRWMGETLARHGLVVAIPDYRKYPQVHMDGFMRDAANAVGWVHAHASEYGGDPQILFLMGHSAGAQIAALLATDGSWLAREPLINPCAGGMMSRKSAGRAARRSAGWLPGQAARCALRAFWTSPMHANSTGWARTVCPQCCVVAAWQATSLTAPLRLALRTDSTGDTCAGVNQRFPVGMQPEQLAGFIGVAGPYDFLPLKDPAFKDMFGPTPQQRQKSQPVNFADGDEPPMLLLQGTADTYVSPHNTYSLARHLRAAGEPVEVHIYPGVDHVHLLLSFSHSWRDSAPALRDTLAFIHAHSGVRFPKR